MLNAIVRLQNMFGNEKGQGMVEYGLIIGLVAVVAVGALALVGPQVSAVFVSISEKFPVLP